MTPRLRRTVVLLSACCGLLGVVPATASAGDATVIPGFLLYNATPGETNVVTISLEAPDCTTAGTAGECYVVTDTGPGVTLTTSGTCTLVSATTATCSAAGVAEIGVDLADADDSFTLTAPTTGNVLGGAGADIVTGGPVGDTVRGQSGADTLAGNGGNDTVYGDDIITILPDASNVISGGDGDDRLEAGTGGDSVAGESGRDTMLGATGNDVLDGGPDADSISGRDGNDALLGQAGNDTLGIADQQGTVPVARERGDDIFDGGPGDDMLQAGIGPTGGVSDSDLFAGGEGTDIVTYEQRIAALGISLDERRNDGALGELDDVQASVENLTSGTGADALTGSAAPNRIDGGGGPDLIDGAAGADALTGSSGDDDVRGGADGDDVQGGTGEDYLDGGTGNDNLTGGGASDAVQSRDAGQDTVNCGERVDFSIADRTDKVGGDCDRVDRDPRDRPRLGTRAALDPVRGSLQLNLPEAQRFVPLELHVNAPVGSSVDATNGRVRVATAVQVGRAAASRSRRQSAAFYGGAFRVRQQRTRRGLTDLSLRGGDFNVCRSGRAYISASKRRVRRLWGDGKGKFRTSGRHSSAAVRGTRWLTEDRCDGTLTRVTKGRVTVFDQVRKRTVQLRAGQRYVARAP